MVRKNGFFIYMPMLTRIVEITDDIRLHETIDFGSYPSWSVSSRKPVYEQLQLGPSPSVSHNMFLYPGLH